jgi:D-arabinose 1-dehydrogenase-like Zn-dependent alcohol dehydrogenase
MSGVTVFNSLRRQNKLAGSLVGVQGVGGLGHYAIQVRALSLSLHLHCSPSPLPPLVHL